MSLKMRFIRESPWVTLAFSFAGDALLAAKGEEKGWRLDMVAPTAEPRWLPRRNDGRARLPIHGASSDNGAGACDAEAPASWFCRSPLVIANRWRIARGRYGYSGAELQARMRMRRVEERNVESCGWEGATSLIKRTGTDAWASCRAVQRFALASDTRTTALPIYKGFKEVYNVHDGLARLPLFKSLTHKSTAVCVQAKT